MAKNKQYTLTTPNPHFNGWRNGVAFTKGTGKTADKAVAQELVKQWGYACKQLAPADPAADAGKKDENTDDPEKDIKEPTEKETPPKTSNKPGK